MVPIVRPPSAERLRVGRALDLGAAGVMLPQLQSAAEVRQAVAYLRYPPVGARGLALRTRGADMGALGHADVARVVNERVVGIVQIESRGALAAADEFAAMDEVDVLFVGPADLSHALGVPGRFDDDAYVAALRTVAEACERHGKAAGHPASTTRRRWRATRSSASGSSGWAPRARSSAPAPRPCWRRPAARSPRRWAFPSRRPPPPRASPAPAPRLGRGAVCATTTATTINPAPTSWIGASVWSRKTQASTTMISGSTVAVSAARAAPILRAPA